MTEQNEINKVESLTQLKEGIWKLLEYKNEISPGIPTEEYYVLLYFLLLQKEGVLNTLISLSGPDLRYEIANIKDRFDEDKFVFFELLQNEFAPIINRLNTGVIQKIISNLDCLNQSLFALKFTEIFDDILFKYLKSNSGFGSEYIIPKEISKFIFGLEDLPENAYVYNPFAGLASFMIFFNVQFHGAGQEINQTIQTLGLMRLIAYERFLKSIYILDDSINNWNFNKEKYDLIISSPPFRMRLPQNINGKFGPIRTVEHFIIEKGIEDLKNDGKLILVLPNRFLSSLGAEQDLRHFLIQNDLLEMVISFPGGLLMNTGIPFSVIVINKNKNKRGGVWFIDATRFVNYTVRKEKSLDVIALNADIKSNKESESKKYIENFSISEFDYTLIVSRYFAPEINIDINENLQQLGNFVSIIRGERSIEGQHGMLIRIRDLKEDKLDYQLDLKVIEEVQIPRHGQRISESCLLLASRWKSLKPTFFKYTGESIFITPDSIALKVDETKVDINYLINELNANYVTSQIESFSMGTAIPYIRREDLLKIQLNSQTFITRGSLLHLLENNNLRLKVLRSLSGRKKRRKMNYIKK